MELRVAFVALFALMCAQASLAGAWDTGPFDNDDALDFTVELLEYDALRAIWIQFSPIIDSNSYIDASVGARAVAAAAIVSALYRNDSSALPAELAQWVKSQKWQGDLKLLGTAEMCVRAILDVEKSELAQLWQGTDQYDAWRSSLNRLRSELE